MRLDALIAALPPERAPREVVGDPAAAVVRGIAIDSRAVAPGDVFVALRGSRADGHDHLAQALRLGAVAVVVDAVPAGVELGACPAIVVRDTRRSLAPLAAAFFGHPARELCLVGVTGTNGKTSTTYLLESMLRAAGHEPGLIGTVEIRYAQERQRAINTTPESLDLQRTLRAMRTHGVDTVAMEVSSHALSIGRTDGCSFRVAAFTNLTQEHLDFHETMEAYLESKTRLFEEQLDPGGTGVVNLDDPAAPAFLAATRRRGAAALGVAGKPDPEAAVHVETSEVGLTGTRAQLRLPSGPLDVELPLLGAFNVENLLVAVGAAVALELPAQAIAAGAAACPQVPGRMERVDSGAAHAPTVIVDYAHTPDAVDKLLRTLRPLTAGRLIAVFGCGGDRDRSKRAPMAAAVARWSDRAVATSDNPRREDPARILADVELGLSSMHRVAADALDRGEKGYVVEIDRRTAIEMALGIAAPGDLVVIAGKGHEDYQIVGDERFPFDDRSEARRVLARREPR